MNTLKQYIISIKGFLSVLPVWGGMLGLLFGFSSCQDMLTPESDLVEFEEENQLNQVTDSLYSVMGIVNCMQKIADRTVLLGEVRADLLSVQDKATPSVKELADCNIQDDNIYNNVAEYYSVINNCNYFINHVDTTLTKLGKKIFDKEYAVVKTYRAWTYLQLAKVYGKVPLVLDPITTISQAELAQQQKYADMNEICTYFINDLKPYVDTRWPEYGVIGNFNESQKFFIPVRVLLGEMCLWAGRYEESAQFFYDYLNNRDTKVVTNNYAIHWPENALSDIAGNYYRIWDSGVISTITDADSRETVSIIPMERSEFNGTISLIKNVYESNRNNDYYAQVIPSEAMKTLARGQNYCQENTLPTGDKDTTYIPKSGLPEEYGYGDLRLYKSYTKTHVNQGSTSHFSADRHYINKFSTDFITIYRVQQIYLMFAEALCCAGYPESAFFILKYGLTEENIKLHMSASEQELASRFIGFDGNSFPTANTLGIHARGCGDAHADSTFCLPVPPTQMSHADSVQYMMPRVEEIILKEMALETAFEGNRFYDLMRVALRRNDPAVLAEPISMREGKKNDDLYSRLMNKENWYLPLPQK